MERRAFKAHPALLRSVIRHQSSTPTKAVLEAVMNSVDAGAKNIAITVDGVKITIVDDGSGFKDKQAVADFFETFGTPHKEGDATFGRFRMGRGQLFNMGKNLWLSNGIALHVDIGVDDGTMEDESPGFGIADDPKAGPGCAITVDLYEPMSPYHLRSIEGDLVRYVKYIATTVTLNGATINKDPKQVKWPLETNEAYFRLNDTDDSFRGLTLYNQGAYVQEFPRARFGLGGTIVSKHRLGLNFARNEILTSCKHWKKIQATLKEHGESRVKKKIKLNDDERASIGLKISSGELPWGDYERAKLFKFSDESTHSLAEIQRLGWKTSNKYSFAATGDRVADSLMQQGLAIVLDDSSFDQFGIDPAQAQDFFGLIGAPSCSSMEYVPLKTLSKEINPTGIILPEAKWTKNETLLLSSLREIGSGLATKIYGEYRYSRRFLLGHSQVAMAWTDGDDYVAIARQTIKKWGYSEAAFAKYALLCLHELCHGDSDIGTHTHNRDFFALYEEHSFLAADLGTKAFVRYQGYLIKAGRSQSKRERTKLMREKEAARNRDLLIAAEPPEAPEAAAA